MDAEKYKNSLETEKVNLESELAGLGHLDEKTGDWQATNDGAMEQEPDTNSLADKYENFEERSSTLDALESRLRDVVAALAKIESLSFGSCELCGEQIENDRLEANPAARTCKSCM